jgi:acylphosphatase
MILMEPRPHRPERADSSVMPQGIEPARGEGFIRRGIHYAGRVQGVGFRMVSQRLAHGFAISGYVRNLPDGRVELVAEGQEAEVSSFLEAIRREFAGYIRSEQSTTEPLSESPTRGFVIRP